MKNMRKGYKWVFKEKVSLRKKLSKIARNAILKTKAEEQIGKTTHRDYRNSIDQRDYLKSKVHNLECVIYEVYAM